MALGPLANVLPWQDETTEKSRDRYFGVYLGFVRDRNDPAKLGRVRIHIPAIMGQENVPDHWTDWAFPMSAGLNVPKPNAPVAVFFEQGFITHPLYQHGWLTGTTEKNSAAPEAGKGQEDPTWLKKETVTAGGTGIDGADFSVDFPADTATDPEKRPKYPYNRAYKTEAGGILEIDESPTQERFRYRHPKGITFLVDTDGSLHIRDGGAYYFHPGGDFVIGLKPGSSFKVVYPGGSGLVVGGMGAHFKGHQASFLGRTIQRKETDI